MSTETLLALTVFAFVSSITPGPNNMMLLASGVNFGFARTVPHLLGVSLGFMVLFSCVGLGLGAVFAASPVLFNAIKWSGVAYLVYLAWRIAHSGAPGGDTAPSPQTTAPVTQQSAPEAAPQITTKAAQPMGFLAACAFQWVNVKAWMMAITGFSAYVPAGSIWLIFGAALVFTAVNLPCVSFWAYLGTKVRVFLSNPTALRWFNYTMAALLLLSLWPVL